MANVKPSNASDSPASEQSEAGQSQAADVANANRRQELDRHADELLRSKRPI